MALGGQLDHGGRRLLAAHQHNADNVHHLRCADRLGVDQPGQQHGPILDIGQHVAHHVAAAAGVYLGIQPILAAEYFCVEQGDNIADFHVVFLPKVLHVAPRTVCPGLAYHHFTRN